MPRVRPPRSDAGQLHFLGTALKTATGDSAENRSYLPAGLVTQVSAFLSDSQQNGVPLPGHTTLLARRAALQGKVTQETADELRHATGKLEPGTARDIMRSYGITFETLEGEVPEPGDVPATPVAPAGS